MGSDLTESQSRKLQNLFDKYSHVFSGPEGKLGNCDIIQHEINIVENAMPIRQRTYMYRLSQKQKEVMSEMLDDMLSQGIIEESTSPWDSLCMLVTKKNNSGYRFVCDYRKLNQCSKIQAQPIPTVKESLDSLGCQSQAWFSSLDLHSGFYQVSIHENSRQYTAFRTHMGLFQFKRLPMGLANSPGTFQRVMEAVLRGLSWKSCLVYLDDIIVFSKNI